VERWNDAFAFAVHRVASSPISSDILPAAPITKRAPLYPKEAELRKFLFLL